MSGERECVYVERAKESALQKARAYVSKYLLPLRKNTVVISAKEQTIIVIFSSPRHLSNHFFGIYISNKALAKISEDACSHIQVAFDFYPNRLCNSSL